MKLLASELLKLRTTRVPYVLLGLTILASGLVTAALVGAGEADADQDDRALALAQGAGFWGMLATVLGILVVTNEYRHDTIMTTFLAEPRRVRVLVAKLATALIGGAVLALGAIVAMAAVALPWLAITEQSLSSLMALSHAPDPDLFIRTGGEVRISNFLLWQVAYAELYFTDCLWPDFDEAQLDAALAAFAGRERRFGDVRAAALVSASES